MRRYLELVSVFILVSGLTCADTIQSTVSNGVSIDFSMTSATTGSIRGEAEGFREGDDVTIQFRLSDAATGGPLNGAAPAAWLDRVPPNDPSNSATCDSAIKTFLGGSPFTRAELDLNTYYVLALNDDPTISVVDPLFGYGGSKLLALINLKSPGDDWALTSDQSRLFVSMPLTGEIAVIDAETWRVVSNLDAGAHSNRLVIQPDGHYLWAATDSGVTVFSLADLKLKGRIPSGAGPHWIVISEDSRFAFVSNTGSGTVSLIDIAKMRKVQDFRTGPRPTVVAYSELSKSAYVVTEGNGTIVRIDGAGRKSFPPIQLKPGISQVKFAPGARYGFVVNPSTNQVFIFDAASGQVLHTAAVENAPDSITFSDKLAYVRHRGSENVLMIPLDAVASGEPSLGVADFSGGRFPPGEIANPSSADGIVQAPGELAVLVANSEDRMIYYYKEGMAAPSGSFSNYSRKPRAVLVVDRSLRQFSPGVFRTTVKLRRPGEYRAAFFLDSPRVVHCFDKIQVAPSPVSEDASLPSVEVFPRPSHGPASPGKPFEVEFDLRDRKSAGPSEGLEDVRILAVQQPGVWQVYQNAKSVGPGIYEAQFTPPESGIYHVYFECLSRRLTVNKSRYVTLNVAEANEADDK